MNSLAGHASLLQKVDVGDSVERSTVNRDILGLLLPGKQVHVALSLPSVLEVLVKVRVIDRVHPVDGLLVLVALVLRSLVHSVRDQESRLQLSVDQAHRHHQ